MGGRDHSCEGCGRGGFNDPDGECECPPSGERGEAVRLAICTRCGKPTNYGESGWCHCEPSDFKDGKLTYEVRTFIPASCRAARSAARGATDAEIAGAIFDAWAALAAPTPAPREDETRALREALDDAAHHLLVEVKVRAGDAAALNAAITAVEKARALSTPQTAGEPE